MHRTVSSIAAAPAGRVFEIVSDLTTYGHWLDLVASAEPAPAAPVDPGPAWSVTIRAKVGPFARSKKLRMVRTVCDEGADGGGTARFERHEVDGRDHAAWILQATVKANGEATTAVDMDLRYEGSLWTTPLEPVLGAFIDGAGDRLGDYANR